MKATIADLLWSAFVGMTSLIGCLSLFYKFSVSKLNMENMGFTSEGAKQQTARKNPHVHEKYGEAFEE